LQHFVESIHLAYARIETQVVDLQKYRRTGFIGEARFASHPALPENYRQALQLLAKFAFFCGVGSHTTMGMGQVSQKR
jgi:CRISPR/Cas system endoribonuclease Cas6 (RAMP superfamily)